MNIRTTSARFINWKAPNSTQTSAVDRVFGTPELLEMILLKLKTTEPYVPQKHLFVLQRISKVFKGTILGSTILLQQMWLARCPPDQDCTEFTEYIRWLSRKNFVTSIGSVLFYPPPEPRTEAMVCAIVDETLIRGGYYMGRTFMNEQAQANRFCRVDASWRKMKLPSVEADHRLNFTCSAVNREELNKVWESNSRKPVDLRQFDYNFDCDPRCLGETLGEAYDIIDTQIRSCPIEALQETG